MWPFKKKFLEKGERPGLLSVQETIEEREIEKMAKKLKQVLDSTKDEIIFLCIGSDRSTGDSFGPMVGTMLKDRKVPFPVYGTLEEPVHALNFKKILKQVKQTHNGPFIVAIDAALGEESQIGLIVLKEGAIFPGKALNKGLPSVGDYHLKAIVNYLDPYKPIESLNTTRLNTVMKLADIVTRIISRAIEDY
ncbi:spore protease YyaC [Bacillus salipaludis]|uniref:Spore protease YyaC n=1 Tax=Bacillus salipaludis TaxID=2547811 RepID=A0A4R5VR18_9BACI|nr:spore protease YyaC [Bacillus salipaludis]MDQ6598617.1 spore protease YyaC [Bacillus salipaludis]TDK60836.1 spore protease YyaC [Bacillus salipaludis]